MTIQVDRLTCPHGDTCGACAYLGVGYADQLRRKGEALARELQAHELLRDAPLLPCLASPVTAGYRNRAKMAIGLSRHGGATVGYFRGGTREIVDAPDCRVLLPPLLDTTRRLRRFLAATPDIPRELRHIDVRCGSDPGRQHMTLVFRAEKCPLLPLDRLRRAVPAVDGFSVNLNPSAGPQVLRGAVVPIWGEREVWVDSFGLRLRVSPGAFFQVNLAILPAIHRLLGEFLGEGSLLADLYAGVGTHGFALGSKFRRVLFIEGTRAAAADLKATIRAQRIANAEVVAASVERSLERLCAAEPEAVVLNPSRVGAHPAVLENLATSSATRVAYLSCEPETLCRDLDALVRRGFEVVSVQPIDMMPQTRQVEALALLRRAPSTPWGKAPRRPREEAPTRPRDQARRSPRKEAPTRSKEEAPRRPREGAPTRSREEAPRTPRRSVAAQRPHRVDPHRPPRRDPAGGQPRSQQERHDGGQGPRVRRADVKEQPGQPSRQGQGRGKAQNRPHRRKP